MTLETHPKWVPHLFHTFGNQNLYICKKISSVRILYSKIQPRPVAKNVPLRPPVGNRIRDLVNLVQSSAPSELQRPLGKSFPTSSAQDFQGHGLDSHYKIDSIGETNGLVSYWLFMRDYPQLCSCPT